MGETFEKFLGTKDYDDKVLLPFERFLHASFRKCYKWNGRDRNLPHSYLAAEDCAARSLSVKPDQAEDKIDGGKVETTKESEEQDDEIFSDSHDGSDDIGDTRRNKEKGKQAKSSAPAGKSEYSKNREKNIAELQNILSDLKAQYPMPVEFNEKELKKQAAKKKKQEKKHKKKEPVERRELQRTKDNRCVMINAHDTEGDILSAALPPPHMIRLRRPPHSLLP
jgi:hypothetical protein